MGALNTSEGSIES